MGTKYEIDNDGKQIKSDGIALSTIGYGVASKGLVSNEMCAIYVTYTVNADHNITKIEEFSDAGKTVLIRQLDITYNADKNPVTITETGALITALGKTNMITTYAYTGLDLTGMSRVFTA